MNIRKAKLIALQQYIDLETGEFLTKNPVGSLLVEKTKRKYILDKQIETCHQCTGLNIKSSTKAVPAQGNLDANIFFVSESPCVHDMTLQTLFINKSGRILDAILALSDIPKCVICMSTSILCHTIRDRDPIPKELNNCSKFLRKILYIVRPKLIVSLGNFAKIAIANINTAPLKCKIMSVVNPAYFIHDPKSAIDYILKISTELDKYK